MSLVLSIFDSRSAVVVSDGRSVHLNEAGNPEIVRNDSRKVFRTKSDQVFALTGQVNLCDPLRDELASFDGSFDDLVQTVRNFVRNCQPEPRPCPFGQISVLVFGRRADGAMSAFGINRREDKTDEAVYNPLPSEICFLSVGYTRKTECDLDRAADLAGFVSDRTGFLLKTLEQISANHQPIVGGASYVETL